MQSLAGIVGRVVATLGFLSLAVSAPTTLTTLSSALTAPVTRTAEQLDRSHKGDRLGIGHVAASQEPTAVTTVEVVGVRDTAIVYRDRGGRVLFRTDPVANVTVVAKDVALPAVTVREHSDAVAPTSPVRTLRQEDRGRRLEGCDPLVSPLASSVLSQAVGRCIAGIETDTKVAMAAR
jgi:hypothetical protein